MEYLKLVGILIIVIGFILKKDAILIIICSAIVTALVGGLGIGGLLDVLGSSFVNNRNIAIFILIILVTATLERNGLKQVAKNLIAKVKNASAGLIIGLYTIMRGIFSACNISLVTATLERNGLKQVAKNLIAKVKNASAGLIIGLYTIMRGIFSACNISFGGVAGFVKPIILPMAIGSIEAKGQKPDERHVEEIKGMSSSAENIGNFFFNNLFIGSSGALLVQGTLKDLGYETSLIDLAKVEIPVAIVALVVSVGYYYIKDKNLYKKCYIDKK